MRCRTLANIGRRQFLHGSVATTATVVTTAGARQARAQTGARLDYPSNLLGNISDLTVDVPFDVTYPDADAPGVLLKLGRAVQGGVGADSDIVGFSTICPHKGYPLRYAAEDRSFNCPGHYSRFDPEAGGQQIWGQATQNLPQYMLRVDEQGDIYADGVDELLYGRLSNVL